MIRGADSVLAIGAALISFTFFIHRTRQATPPQHQRTAQKSGTIASHFRTQIRHQPGEVLGHPSCFL